MSNNIINTKLVKRFLAQKELVSILYFLHTHKPRTEYRDAGYMLHLKKKIKGAQRHMSSIVQGTESKEGHVVATKAALQYWRQEKNTQIQKILTESRKNQKPCKLNNII